MSEQTTQTRSGMAWESIAYLIEDQQRYEYANALSLMALAQAQERTAVALERIAGTLERFMDDVVGYAGDGEHYIRARRNARDS